jgi:hypothetical protein
MDICARRTEETGERQREAEEAGEGGQEVEKGVREEI